jgi:MFS transporter, OFA family, oxalate/formate antiporter
MSQASSSPSSVNLGWRVTFAGMGINLALGILYSWSVISKGIPTDWEWTETQKSLPYMFACLIFSLVMVPAGRMQDKISPRIVATIGGILVGIGFVVASFTTSCIGFIVGFGILAGAGIGFGYASATPPAVKWFPAAKTGLIAGLVVSGFGLASVYTAPLTRFLVIQYGLQNAMLILGIAFLILIVGLKNVLMPFWVGLSNFLQTPPKEYIPATSQGPKLVLIHDQDNLTPLEMLRTVQFPMIWFMYACGAGAGLMVIAKLAAIVKELVGRDIGFALVAVLAIGNGAGRIGAGMLSDRIGRKNTLFICFVVQAVLIMVLSTAKTGSNLASVPLLSLIAALIGANYGANLALFPSLTKDFYGIKNFGVNYGLVFTSWGVGGFMLAYLAGKMYDIHKTFAIAYYGASILLVLAAAMVLFLKAPQKTQSAPAA